VARQGDTVAGRCSVGGRTRVLDDDLYFLFASLPESPLRVACSVPDPARSPISDDGDAGRTRDGRGAWSSVNSRSRTRSSLAQVASGAMPWWSVPPAHASCARWLASAFLLVVVARCCVQPDEIATTSPSISSLCSLLRWRPDCSSLSFEAIVELVGGSRRSGELDFAVWEGAHPQWRLKRGNGARIGGWQPVLTVSPLNVLAEGRLSAGPHRLAIEYAGRRAAVTLPPGLVPKWEAVHL
jgi:hypothetical protein